MVRGITERDNALFRKLGDFGVLSSSQIRELFFKDVVDTVMYRRLRILEENELIRRIPGHSIGAFAWALTQNCARELGIAGIFKNIASNTVEHDLVMSQVRLSLESVGVGATWIPEHVLRFRAWEERNRNGKAENVPDGIFTYEQDGEFLAVAVELEKTPKNTDRYKKSLQGFRFSRNLSMIWYLVPSKALGERIERIWSGVKGGSSVDVYWTLTSQAIEIPYDIELNSNGERLLFRNIVQMKSPERSTLLAHNTDQPLSTLSNKAAVLVPAPNPLNT